MSDDLRKDTKVPRSDLSMSAVLISSGSRRNEFVWEHTSTNRGCVRVSAPKASPRDINLAHCSGAPEIEPQRDLLSVMSDILKESFEYALIFSANLTLDKNGFQKFLQNFAFFRPSLRHLMGCNIQRSTLI